MEQKVEQQLDGIVVDIKAYVCELAFIDEDEIGDDGALFSAGLIDSVSLIQLVGFVEQRCKIKITPSQLTLENWDSLSCIRDFIAKELAA
ncbi:MAG: acyl carrier protein [Planctomycetota bacterium]|jgi:acyl carrier protein